MKGLFIKRSIRNVLLAAALIISSASHAEFIHTDWKSNGDQKATLDTDTGIEWLKLSQTSSMSYNQVAALLSTTYAGWRLPTSAEVIKMFNNLLGNPYGSADGISAIRYQTISSTNANKFYTYFGLGGGYSYGWFARDDATVGIGGGGVWATSQFYTYWEYGGAGALNNARGSTGVFLVSDGGTTLSSQLNPNLNAMNPNAPVNQVTTPTPTPTPVSANMIALGTLLLALSGIFRKVKQ